VPRVRDALLHDEVIHFSLDTCDDGLHLMRFLW
jgi:hypothetical protein